MSGAILYGEVQGRQVLFFDQQHDNDDPSMHIYAKMKGHALAAGRPVPLRQRPRRQDV